MENKKIFLFDFDDTLTSKRKTHFPDKITEELFESDDRKKILQIMKTIKFINEENKIFILTRGSSQQIGNYLKENFIDFYNYIDIIELNENNELNKLTYNDSKNKKGIIGHDNDLIEYANGLSYAGPYHVNGPQNNIDCQSQIQWGFIKTIIILKIKNIYPDYGIFFFDDNIHNISMFNYYVKDDFSYSFHIKKEITTSNDCINKVLFYIINLNKFLLTYYTSLNKLISEKFKCDFESYKKEIVKENIKLNVDFYDTTTKEWHECNFNNLEPEYTQIKNLTNKYKSSVGNFRSTFYGKNNSEIPRCIIFSKSKNEFYINNPNDKIIFKPIIEAKCMTGGNNYKNKYLKYKNKYLQLKKQYGGNKKIKKKYYEKIIKKIDYFEVKLKPFALEISNNSGQYNYKNIDIKNLQKEIKKKFIGKLEKDYNNILKSVFWPYKKIKYDKKNNIITLFMKPNNLMMMYIIEDYDKYKATNNKLYTYPYSLDNIIDMTKNYFIDNITRDSHTFRDGDTTYIIHNNYRYDLDLDFIDVITKLKK